ncbi:hypothetical protein J6590_031865 [Homalodisca vitripennis]|nr:hypothetical protein J6590_031865 [Homalodisca vitripennis]
MTGRVGTADYKFDIEVVNETCLQVFKETRLFRFGWKISDFRVGRRRMTSELNAETGSQERVEAEGQLACIPRLDGSVNRFIKGKF